MRWDRARCPATALCVLVANETGQCGRHGGWTEWDRASKTCDRAERVPCRHCVRACLHACLRVSGLCAGSKQHEGNSMGYGPYRSPCQVPLTGPLANSMG